MTDSNERIAALETSMSYVRDVLAKREEYQTGVLIKLDRIEGKQDSFLVYQKTCDAERLAHGTRLGRVEDDVKKLRGIDETLADHEKRIGGVEKKFEAGGWFIRLLKYSMIAIGSVTTFAATVISLYKMVHP